MSANASNSRLEAEAPSSIGDGQTVVVIEDANPNKRLAATATGSVIGAILASSCCILPLVLVTLGASGAWIGNLTVLAPYKPIFAAVTFIFLGFGYWQVYRKPKITCEEGSYCASPASNRIAKGALWIATILVLLALSIDFWAPLFY